MKEPIEDRGSDHLVAEYVAPLGDHLIAGDEHAASFVASSDELEEEVGGLLLESQVAELVDEGELWLRVEGQLLGELPFGLGPGQCGEQRGGGDEEDGVARLDDGAAERDGHARNP